MQHWRETVQRWKWFMAAPFVCAFLWMWILIIFGCKKSSITAIIQGNLSNTEQRHRRQEKRGFLHWAGQSQLSNLQSSVSKLEEMDQSRYRELISIYALSPFGSIYSKQKPGPFTLSTIFNTLSWLDRRETCDSVSQYGSMKWCCSPIRWSKGTAIEGERIFQVCFSKMWLHEGSPHKSHPLFKWL